MIGPSKINNGGITFTVHCLPIQTANTAQLWRKTAENLTVFRIFFPHCVENRPRRR